MTLRARRFAVFVGVSFAPLAVMAQSTAPKNVGAAEHLEEEFAVFLAACEGSSQLRMSAEDVSPLDKFVRDAPREVGKPFVEECCKSIEVGTLSPYHIWCNGLRRPSASSPELVTQVVAGQVLEHVHRLALLVPVAEVDRADCFCELDRSGV